MRTRLKPARDVLQQPARLYAAARNSETGFPTRFHVANSEILQCQLLNYRLDYGSKNRMVKFRFILRAGGELVRIAVFERSHRVQLRLVGLGN